MQGPLDLNGEKIVWRAPPRGMNDGSLTCVGRGNDGYREHHLTAPQIITVNPSLAPLRSGKLSLTDPDSPFRLRIAQLEDSRVDCDFFCGGNPHSLHAAPTSFNVPRHEVE